MNTGEVAGWIDISEEGFALENAGRPPAHLAKELVQNALDAIDRVDGGRVGVDIRFEDGLLGLTVTDNGHGIPADRLLSVRTVFLTTKRDDPTRRGRMGRGFKEPLSMAGWATVSSGTATLRFCTDESGRRVTRVEGAQAPVAGTRVAMGLRWGKEQVDVLADYFRGFLVPRGAVMTVNGQRVTSRPAVHTVEGKLTTELFVDGLWKKEKRQTAVELVALLPGESPMIFELGIPVCPLEWDQPFHANVLQRVPMNPKRDMVMPGYPAQVHKIALPVLLPTMTQEQVLTDWVGAVAPGLPEDVQKQVIRRGLGDQIVRAVPVAGRRDYNADAPRLGLETVDVRKLPGGLGEIVRQHVPTARQAVEQREADERLVAARNAVPVDEDQLAADHARAVEAAGGKARVRLVMDWAQWFVRVLLDEYTDSPVVSVTASLLQRPILGVSGTGPGAIATWASAGQLSLALEHLPTWHKPFSPDSLRMLIHEAAHHRNMHHGARFAEEVERLAGRAAWLMLEHGETIRARFRDLIVAP